jgi:HK97 family phage major capsid protein
VPYNSLTTRIDVAPLIPEQVATQMLGKAVEDSAVLQMFRHIPVARNQVRFPIISALPVAYWVTGDTGLKQTTEMAWDNKFMQIEELATIMPIPESVIEDMDQDIWGTSEPFVREAFARTLDSAVFFGSNAPASFPTNILAAAVAAGNTVTEATATAAQGGYMGDLDNLISAVEEDGFDVTGYIAARGARRKFRAARDTTGRKLDAGRFSPELSSFDGAPIAYPMRGLWATNGSTGTNVRLFAGDFVNEFVVGVRRDISMKLLDQAVIQDNTGAIIYNLAQQDMVAMRYTFRVGWQVSNRLNNDNPNAATRYPAAVMVF